MNAHKQANRKLARRLTLVAVAMFGFGFAMWPLYTVFCEVTGFGGRGIKQVEAGSVELLASDRDVKIQFDATVNESDIWSLETALTIGDAAKLDDLDLKIAADVPE